ncbi:MAG: hypothetical protein ABJB47_06185, partial [Actinomycetota bacterium]
MPRLPIRLAVAITAAALAGAVGCGTAAPAGHHASPGPVATPSATRTDVPEPAVAPPAATRPAGRVVSLPGGPEGLAVDDRDGVLAVGVRSPDGVALVSAATGRVRKLIHLAGAPRHLQVAGRGRLLLVPLEGQRRLVQLALPGGAVVASTMVGHQPHDAAGAGSLVFVGNEYADTVSLVRGGKQIAVEPAPVQPGGVAAARDGSVVVVVGVRGRQIKAYTGAGRPLGTAPAGVGPTHVRAGSGRLFYVADTEGNAVLVYRVGAHGPRQVQSVPTEPGRPYGIAVDSRRHLLYVTLTASNRLESFRISARG